MSSPSWLDIPRDSDFSLLNLPFGIITYPEASSPRPAVAIADHALDLQLFSQGQGFADLPSISTFLHVFQEPTLKGFSELGRPVHQSVRDYLQQVFRRDTPFPLALRDNPELRTSSLVPLSRITMHMPFRIGDYTDFYAGKHHAYNVGVLFRGPDDAFQPNYTHLPVGYHGRASSVVVSGTPIRRPWGQILDENQVPIHHPSKLLDIELELGAFISKSNKMGTPVPVDQAEQHIFGYVLLNDWSARDIQGWEYIPLGPFNSKNFASTISPWVVLADALEPFRTEGIQNDNEILSYLKTKEKRGVFDVKLEVSLRGKESPSSTTITRSNGRHLLWSYPQMIAHHTTGGCPLNTGDLLGSGTISGPTPGSEGCLLEMTKAGKNPVAVAGGTRRFLEDGDEVTLRGWCENGGGRVGFGECKGVVLPAWETK